MVDHARLVGDHGNQEEEEDLGTSSGVAWTEIIWDVATVVAEEEYDEDWSTDAGNHGIHAAGNHGNQAACVAGGLIQVWQV